MDPSRDSKSIGMCFVTVAMKLVLFEKHPYTDNVVIWEQVDCLNLAHF